MNNYSIREAQSQDEETRKLINFLLVTIENIVIGKTARVFGRHFKLRKLAELYSEALGKNISYERIRQLAKKYSNEGGEQHV